MEYKKDIAAQQQQHKDEEKRKFAHSRPGFDASGSSLHRRSASTPDLSLLGVKNGSDAVHPFQAHEAGLTLEDNKSAAVHSLKLGSQDISVKSQQFMGPFLEDLDSHIYYDIKDLNKARSLNESIPVTQSHAGGPAKRSPQSVAPVAHPQTQTSPVYATVKKPEKSSTTLPDMSYIESNSLHGVYENTDLPEADKQLVDKEAEPQPSPRLS